MCCSVLQFVAVRHDGTRTISGITHVLQCTAMRCNASQCVAVCCSALQCVAVQCVAVRHDGTWNF